MKLASINKVDISLKQLLDVDTSGGSINTVDAIRNGQVLTAYVTTERKDQFRFKDFSSFLAAGTGISLSSSNGVTTISSTGAGSTTLASLTDVALSSPILGDVLMYNGTDWYNTPLAGGGDMTKAVYDTDNDGVVDSSERIQIVVRNSTGATLTKGQVVYLSGATGNRPNALLADASTETTSSKTIGIVIADIANNSDGSVAVNGTLHDLDTSAFTAGDTLWLSETAGAYQANTPPSEPAHAVFIGYVARSHPNLGRVVLAIQNGYELNELHGVLTPTPSNNDVLRYNSTSGLWEDDSIATILGFTPIQLSSLSASSPLSYNSGTGVFSIPVATSLANGYLSSTDWTTFNGKESALTFNSPLSRSTNTISIPAATSSVNGYLTSTDWTTFNGKIGGSGTTNEIAYFTAGTTLGSLTTATYPSLTELSYVKGVTSNIQTQINGLGGSYASYTMKGNNTGASATPADHTFRYPSNQTFSGTITTSAGTWGAGSYYYNWHRIGNMVNYTFQFIVTTPSSITSINWDLPADMPSPVVPSGFSANSVWLIRNFVTMVTTTTGTTQTTFSGGLRVKSTVGPTFDFYFSGTAGSYKTVTYNGTYFTS